MVGKGNLLLFLPSVSLPAGELKRSYRELDFGCTCDFSDKILAEVKVHSPELLL